MKIALNLKVSFLFSVSLFVSASCMSTSASDDLKPIHEVIKHTYTMFKVFEEKEKEIRYYDTQSTRENLRNKYGQPEACLGLMGFFFKLNKLLRDKSLVTDYQKWHKLAVNAAPLQHEFCKWMGKLSDEGKAKIVYLYSLKNSKVNIITFLDAVETHGDLSWIFEDKTIQKESSDKFTKTIDAFKSWIKDRITQ